MTTSLPGNSSQVARLMVAPPGFAVGWQEPVYIPDPAAGAEIDYVVDGRYYERLICATYDFTTSAAVASRFTELTLFDASGRKVTAVPGPWNQTASSHSANYLMQNAPVFDLSPGGDNFGFIPDLLVPPGWSWRTVTASIDAGDQYSGIVFLVQRFPNDATSITAGE